MSQAHKRQPVPRSELIARLRMHAAPDAEAAPQAAAPERPPSATETEPHKVFNPTHVSSRHDGWTAERQVAFIAALADTGSVDQAAAHVGMNRASAYRLRRHPDAQDFADAWWHAQRINLPQLCDTLLDQCINGVVTERWYRGEYIGQRRTFIPAIAFNLLKRFEEQDLLFATSKRQPGRETHAAALISHTRQLADISPDDKFIANDRAWRS